MLCVTCKSEVSAVFKHAIAKNECPACGGAIFDEETLALIDDIRGTILGEAVLRDETVQRLALAIVTRYDLAVCSGARTVSVAAVAPVQVPAVQRRIESRPAEQPATEEEVDMAGVKVAPPSAFQKIASTAAKPNVVSVSDLERQASISDMERMQIMEEAAKTRYGLVDQVTIDNQLTQEDISMLGGPGSGVSIPAGLIDDGVNPILEQERIARLQKQKAALDGSIKSAFRRSG